MSCRHPFSDPHSRPALRHLLAFLFRSPALASESAPLIGAAPALTIRQIFRRFWPYARPYRRNVALTLGLAAVAPALDTARVWLFKIVVDDVLVPRDFTPFWWIAGAYVALSLAGGFVSATDRVLSSWVGGRFLVGLRTAFFTHLQGLSLGFFERRRLGDVMSRLTGDIASIEQFVLSGVTNTVSYVLRILFFTAALFYLDWRMALVSLVVVPLFWLTARYFSTRIRLASRERGRRSGSISAIAEESLSNAALVQAYNRQATEIERFQNQTLGSFDAHMDSARARALMSPLINLIEVLGALVLIAIGTWSLAEGRISLGSLLVFFTYVGQLYSPVRGVARLGTSLSAATAAAERVVEFLDEQPAIRERERPHVLARARGIVEFDRVSFTYPDAARPAVTDVSFRVGPGETLALVGRSGAGKSTIAKLLLRFYDPSEGTIRLDGHDLRDLQLASLRQNIAVLLQDALVFDASVRENIAYGRAEASDDAIVRAAQAADAHEFIAALPEGYDAQVGQKGRRLSGGQRQRVAIARAMIRDAPVLVLDEPTTGLDTESGWRLMEPLRRLMSGRATIVISHNFVTVRDATSILVLDEGRVVERGTHTELAARGGIYSALYALHQGPHLRAAASASAGDTETRVVTPA